MPSLKNIPLAQIKNMDLSAANRVLEENHSGRNLFQSPSTVLDEPFSELEITSLIRKCIDGGSVPVIATLHAPFSNMFRVPETGLQTSNDTDLGINQLEISQLYFSSFYKTEFEHKSIDELHDIAESIDFSRSLEELSLIERVTRTNRDQWRWFRIGKITGTSFKNCVRTNVENPSSSTIKSICYPTIDESNVPALIYGKKFEKTALDQAILILQSKHSNLKVQCCGVIVSSTSPYFASTPDGLCCCECCGEGIIEIKCPFNLKNGGKIENLKISDPYLTKLDDGNWGLVENHKYYFQIQMELFTTDRNHGFFVVWSQMIWLF